RSAGIARRRFAALAATDGSSRAAVPTAAVSGDSPRAAGLRRLSAEIDLGHLLRLGWRLEEGVFLEAEHLRRHVGGELPARRVVLLHTLVVAHALDGEAILRAGQLVYQAVELFVGLELRIVFDDGEQPSKGGALAIRRGNALLRRLRAQQLRTGVGDVLVDAFFVLRIAFHGFHEVRDEVVSTLQLVLDLRPLRFDRLFLADESVVGAAGQRHRDGRDHGDPQ